MITLRHTLNTLRAAIPAHSPRWDAARTRQPALATYASPIEVLAAFAPDASTDATHASRIAIVQALLTERRASDDSLWSTLLLLAFEPMLANRSRRQLFGKGSDAVQSMLAAFLHATKTADPRAFAVQALARDFDEAWLAPLRRTPEPELISSPVAADDELIDAGAAEDAQASEAASDDHICLAVDIAKIAHQVGGSALAAALAGAARHGSLEAYVAAEFPPDEQESALKRFLAARRTVWLRLNGCNVRAERRLERAA